VSQCSFQRAAEHDLQFFISNNSTVILFKAITRGTEAFGMGEILSGTESLPTGHRLHHKVPEVHFERLVHHARARLGEGWLLLASSTISDPDFGFGVDPGRLRGYPLAHLAGTWW
jgi:hypothetical protein